MPNHWFMSTSHFRHRLSTSRPGIKLCEYLILPFIYVMCCWYAKQGWISWAPCGVPLAVTGAFRVAFMVAESPCIPGGRGGQAAGQPSCLMLMHTALWQAQWQADLSQAEIMPGFFGRCIMWCSISRILIKALKDARSAKWNKEMQRAQFDWTIKFAASEVLLYRAAVESKDVRMQTAVGVVNEWVAILVGDYVHALINENCESFAYSSHLFF